MRALVAARAGGELPPRPGGPRPRSPPFSHSDSVTLPGRSDPRFSVIASDAGAEDPPNAEVDRFTLLSRPNPVPILQTVLLSTIPWAGARCSHGSLRRSAVLGRASSFRLAWMEKRSRRQVAPVHSEALYTLPKLTWSTVASRISGNSLQAPAQIHAIDLAEASAILNCSHEGSDDASTSKAAALLSSVGESDGESDEEGASSTNEEAE